MKKLLSYAVPFMLGIIAVGGGLILLSIFVGCTPAQMIAQTKPVTRTDTTVTVRERLVTDTIVLGGEYVEHHDTVNCPPGLVRDSLVYINDVFYVAGKTVTVQVPVHDTVRTVQAVPLPAQVIFSKDYGWGERLAWLTAVLAMLAAWWKKWKKEQGQPVT